ncbi:hypothetical protein F5Y10DRAFT_196580 [Nemania abortiva]|nr:hypothetical protein F5Y10DRAFT_196580 [Nemania abortiva]
MRRAGTGGSLPPRCRLSRPATKRKRDDDSQTYPNKKAKVGSPQGLPLQTGLTPATTATLGSLAVNTASGGIPRPSRREDFEIAIICALPLEYDAVTLLFDEFWDKDGDSYGRAIGDHNTYTTGHMGHHNVVLVLLPQIGKAHAAGAAASLRASYTRLRLAFLAGICGGVPQAGKQRIFLGDVIISSDLIQYDFGRRYPNRFVRKDTIKDSLSGPSKDIRSLLAIFQAEHGREQLQQRATGFLNQLQIKAFQKKRKADYSYPGVTEDKLFESSYRHMHRVSPTCACRDCQGRLDPVCDEALRKSCIDLGCDEQYLVLRERVVTKQQLGDSGGEQQPMIHVGSIASGDTVMKSGEDRDVLAKEEGVIAFEMEGAGIWEEIQCIVVKGVCDYADSHKNKKWQDFAAATAASVSKAILERYAQKDSAPKPEAPKLIHHWAVPFGRNEDFVGREAILHQLLERIPPGANKDDCQYTALEGLGGIGKTQIALEAAFRIHGKYPDCSVLWVPAINATTFESAYRSIGRRFDIVGIDADKADVKMLVKTALSREDSGRWLLIIDNADDTDLFFGPARLSDYIPFSKTGSVLFTTRNHQVTVNLNIPKCGTYDVMEMSRAETTKLLQMNLKEAQICDADSTSGLLEFLADLPLAIKQASAFMAQTGITITKYLERCHLSEKSSIKLLSKNFEDRGRYRGVKNPIAATWLISFEHISRTPLAVRYLKYMSFIAEKGIPRSLLPLVTGTDELQADEAIGILKAYAFITQRGTQDLFDVHRLVHLVMRAWLEENGEQEEYASEVMQHVAKQFPFPEHENRDVWMSYLPHAQALLNRDACSKDPNLLLNVGASFIRLGNYREAEQVYRQAFELREKLYSLEHPTTLDNLDDLASSLQLLELYDKAEQMGRQVVEFREKMYGRKHPDMLRSMKHLAWTLWDLGKYEESRQMGQQVVELIENTCGQEGSRSLASMLTLSSMLYLLERNVESEQVGRQAFELAEKVYGRKHHDTVRSIGVLPLVLCRLGRYNEAELLRRRDLELDIELYGEEHPITVSFMSGLCPILLGLERYHEAEQIARQAFESMKKVGSQGRLDTICSMNDLTSILPNLGRCSEAEKMGREALELGEKVYGREHLVTLSAMNALAVALKCQGKHEEAVTLMEECLRSRTRILGSSHRKTGYCRNKLEEWMASDG